MIAQIKASLESNFDKTLVEKLLVCFFEMKKRFTNDPRGTCLDGGRFSEAALRMLQQKAHGSFTPLGQKISNFTDEIQKLHHIPTGQVSESLRIQIPRALQIVYDIRNKRDVGHLGGDIDANYMDANLSMTTCSWVLSELIRIYYNCDMNIAQRIVDNLFKYKTPLIQDFNGFLKILKPELSVEDKIIVLLYHKKHEGATNDDLRRWLKTAISRRTSTFFVILNKLEHTLAFIHRDGERIYITDSGIKYVEENLLDVS